MSMPGSWSGWKGNVVGPNVARVPMPSTPAPSSQSAVQRSTNMIPDQPQPGQVAATLEHLTGRPADPAEVQQLLEDTQVTYGDYAPGGEVAQSGDGGRQVQ
jgi:hypothetical protein